MKSKSNVTVIIPCYNDGAYIMQALNSVLNQTVKAEQIIIVDDGSLDETKAILNKINEANVVVVFQENKGVSNARNKAINLAKTEFVLNLDADDYIEPKFIEKTLEVLKTDKTVGVVSSYCRTFKNKNKTLEIVKPLGGMLKDFIIKNNGRANALFRKRCWEEVGGYDEIMVNGYEDWEFWIAVLKNNWSMYIIPEVLSSYRVKQTSRDKTAIQNFDFELRQYIFNKHREVFEKYFDYYSLELLRRNTVLKNSVYKFKNSMDYKIGAFILAPVRFLKRKING